MEKMTDLKDLLKHEILDLYSAEEQIIEALPSMIEKAQNKELKRALNNHLKITEQQKKRLDKVKELVSDEGQQPEQGDEKKGFFSRLFNGSEGTQKCRGMEGLIDEGQKVMGEDMSPEALDAAIIGCAQKIEHYEISGYGTAKAYAKELRLNEVEKLLDETLSEEYQADTQLTELAVNRLNMEAEQTNSPGGNKGEQQGSKPAPKNEVRPNRKEGSEKPAPKKAESQSKKKENAPARSASSTKESKSSKANNKEKAPQKKNAKSPASKAKKSAGNKQGSKSR